MGKEIVHEMQAWMMITAAPLNPSALKLCEDKIKSHRQIDIYKALVIIKEQGLDKVCIGCKDPRMEFSGAGHHGEEEVDTKEIDSVLSLYFLTFEKSSN